MHELIERKSIFGGKVIRVYLDQVRLPDGVVAEREVVEHGGAVGIVPVDEDGTVTLVRQYRHATGESLLEIPAGKLDRGEAPEECAYRELEEEVGLTTGHLRKLSEFYTSPGFSNEVLHLFLAEDLTVTEAAPEDDEFLEVETMPLAEALDLVLRRDIRDSKTVAGIALACVLKGVRPGDL
ncbi:MAG: NUDIX hydrolase [Candidatus Geothermincolia bacterium]